MRRIVCDTGPLISLHEADLLELLPEAGRLFLPEAVEAELETLDPIPAWLEIVSLEEPFTREFHRWFQSGMLDSGEAEAIALAKQLEAEWLVTDDAAARLVAQREGIEVHGSLGIVLWAAATGHLDFGQAQAALEALAKSSLWVSTRVLEEARSILPRLCSRE